MNLFGVIATQILFLAIQVVLYFGSEIFQKNPTYVDIPLDRKIPLIPLFSLIYVLWFPAIALFPIHLFSISSPLYKTYLLAWILDVLASVAIYLTYPTTFERPRNVERHIGGKILKYIYRSNYKGFNCTPSLHCSLSTLIFLFAVTTAAMPFKFRIFYALLSVAIIVSTLFTKQHVIVDAVSGTGLGILCFLFIRMVF